MSQITVQTVQKNASRYLKPAYVKGRRYSAKIEDEESGMVLICREVKGEKRLCVSSLVQAAFKMIPRSYKRSHRERTTFTGTVYKIPIERKHR